MDICLDYYEHVPSFEPIPRYPSSERDIAFIMDISLESGVIKEASEKIGKPLVKEVDVFDVNKGENLPEGKKSVAYSLIYRDPAKTLTDADIESSFENIIHKFNEKYGTYVRE